MKTRWTSRRRVEAALNHQEPDRVPLSMTITEIPYLKLRKYLGLPPHPEIRPNRFGEVNPGLDLIKTLGFDTLSIKLGITKKKSITAPGTRWYPLRSIGSWTETGGAGRGSVSFRSHLFSF